MRLTSFLPHLKGCHIDDVVVDPSQITIRLTAIRVTARCPLCHRRSKRVHSSYPRTVTDLPWSGRPVTLHLRSRRFVCTAGHCPRRIFTERLPGLVGVHGRQTEHRRAALQEIGFALGGNPGARLSRHLGMPTSRSTILRLLRSIPTPEHPTPRVLGVDDWAKRKGQTYGTLLCDLERHRPVDLLSDRLADSLVDWLATHAGVEIISRDRAGAYAEGASRGAPDAIQVADRWHLLKNLGDALERLLDRHAADLHAVSRAVAPAVTEATPMSKEPPPVVPEPVGQRAPIRATADRERRRAKRVARYEEVCALHLQGASIHAIAEQLGLARRTVRRYIRAETFPEIAQRPKRSCILDPYEPYLRQRWNEGCHNGYQLWREITDQGYRGGRTTLSRFATRMRQEQGIPPRQRRLPDEHATTGQRSAGPKRASVRPLSARHLAWLFTRRPDDLTARQQAEVSQMRGRAASLATAYDLAQSFALMVRERRATDLLGWIEKVTQCGVAELQGFADGLCRDWDAVQAALSLPWSQGQTEGQITRLKLLKRQMYGRAGFDLLRLRMLHAA